MAIMCNLHLHCQQSPVIRKNRKNDLFYHNFMSNVHFAQFKYG